MTFLRKLSYIAGAVTVGIVGWSALNTPKAKDVPFVPTPPSVVRAMLDLAEAKPTDVLYDLGSGDGRIVITAIKDYGVKKGVGVDIDPERVADGRRNAQEAGVTDRARFVEGNVFTFDFSEASVLTMYLLPNVNMKLRPRVLSELKPGTRVVSHQFDMGDWKPDEERREGRADIYLWIVPAKVDGTWTWKDAAGSHRLTLKQKYQVVEGTLATSGNAKPIGGVRLNGDALAFEALGAKGGALRFQGKVSGDRIAAKVNGADVVAERLR